MTAIDAANQIAETRRQVDQLWRQVDPDTLAERLTTARRLLSLARQTADDQLVADAWRLFLMTLLEAERIAEIDVTLGELRAYCVQEHVLASRDVLAWFRGLRAVLDGDPDQAEALLASSLSRRARLGPLTVVRCFQGRFDELEPLYLEARREDPRPVHVIMLAWLWTQQGRIAAARGAVDTVGPISALPRDRDWLFALSLLAELSVLLDDRALAETVHRTLVPYSRRIVLIGDGAGCWGSVDRPLGLLSRFLGRFEEAAEHFTAKNVLSAAAGAHPWLARSQLDLAELLLDAEYEKTASGGTGHDVDERIAEAAQHAREGIAAVRRLNYPALKDRADRIEQRLRSLGIVTKTPDREPAAPTTSTVTNWPRVNILGRFEVVNTNGELAEWSSRKARQLLSALISYRGRPVSRERLMEHLWPGEPPSRLRNRLAVAVSTVRTSIDPFEHFDRQEFVSTTRETVRVRLESLPIDAEEFLSAASSALVAEPRTEAELTGALRSYTGEAFPDDPYSDWAAPLRDECRVMQVALLHAIIDTATSSVYRAELARRILDIDPYDNRAHDVLVDALEDLGARGLAAARREQFQASLNLPAGGGPTL